MKISIIHSFRRARIVLCGILAMAAIMIGCTKDPIILPNPDEEQPSGTPLVIVIYGPNSLGDRSYCDMIYYGVERAAQQHGLRTLQFSPESDEEGLAYLETIISEMEQNADTVRRLLITPGVGYDTYIRANSHRLESNPRADLLYMETTTPLESKGSTLYIDYYGAMYMGGAWCITRLMTTTKNWYLWCWPTLIRSRYVRRVRDLLRASTTHRGLTPWHCTSVI